ncbi:ATP-binding protein [Maridesulfovibrio frigidus]|uniref:ATP-binding protein n=1 Tax=Maridesulfovibrio frigidus TaxID=340956 RepID=UPI000A73F50A|nr:ATP-binding protein [Maridesulfovibrio frigidus]
MNIIDLRTLLLSYGLISAVSGLAVIFLGFKSRERLATLWWGGGCIVLGTGSLLVALRGYIPTIVSMFFANFLVFAGTVCIWAGMRVFMKRKQVLGRLLLCIMLPSTGLYYYSMVDPSLYMRCFFVFGAMTFYELMMALELFRGARSIHKIFGSVFALLGGVYLFWLIALTSYLSSSDLMSETVMFPILYLSSIIFQILFISCLVMLMADRMNETLQVAKDSAETASKAKSDFLATMSHEIRTPICTVMGLSDLNLDSECRGGRDEDLQTIHSASNVLLSLIDDVLDYSKIEAGEVLLNSSVFYLDEVLDQVMDITAGAGISKGLDISFVVDSDVPPCLVGDSNRVRQILINILINAVKFTPTGMICLSVSMIKDEFHDFVLKFSIRDTGIGITVENQEKIFESFIQVDGSTTRNYGGVGLGLAICSKLVTLMEGGFKVRSAPGSGSEFIVTLPFRLGSDDDSSIKQWEGCEALLFVGRELAAQQMKNILELFGFKVVEKSNLEDLRTYLNSLGSSFPELAVIDASENCGVSIDFVKELEMCGCKSKLIFYPKPLGATEFISESVPVLVQPLTIRKLFLTVADVLKLDKSLIPRRFLGMRGALYDIPVQLPVLLVEDSDINRSVLSRMISSLNIVVETARDGSEAVEKVRNGNFSLVFMDIQMPVMSGFEAAEIILEELGDEAPVIVALSADKTTSTFKRAQDIGFADFLGKPVTLKVLRSTLSRFLGVKKENSTTIKSDFVARIHELGIVGINAEAAEKDYFGDIDFYFRQLTAYSVRVETFITELKGLLENSDFEKIKVILHSVRGTAALLKFDSLRGKFEDLEGVLYGEDHTQVGSVAAVVVFSCADFVKAIASIQDL